MEGRFCLTRRAAVASITLVAGLGQGFALGQAPSAKALVDAAGVAAAKVLRDTKLKQGEYYRDVDGVWRRK